jgi:hypothetical protein
VRAEIDGNTCWRDRDVKGVTEEANSGSGKKTALSASANLNRARRIASDISP